MSEDVQESGDSTFEGDGVRNKKAFELMRDMQTVELPWSITRLFPMEKIKYITFCRGEASLGEDYCNLHEIREAIDWLADQFNGKVKWK